MPKFIDVHAHIQEPEFDADRTEVLARMREAEVGAIVVSVGAESSRKAVALAETETTAALWAAVGQHPSDFVEEIFDPEAYRALLSSPKVVAIGECGLDYYRLPQDPVATLAEKERQRALFDAQVELALAADKPLMIHCRPTEGTMDAHEELIHILSAHQKEVGERLRGNVHFFTGTQEIAEQYIQLGFTLSFSGVVTFTKGMFDDLLRRLPLEFVHAETDAPYASPAPFRGQRNEPIHVCQVVEYITQVRKEELKTVVQVLQENAQRMFFLN